MSINPINPINCTQFNEILRNKKDSKEGGKFQKSSDLRRKSRKVRNCAQILFILAQKERKKKEEKRKREKEKKK